MLKSIGQARWLPLDGMGKVPYNVISASKLQGTPIALRLAVLSVEQRELLLRYGDPMARPGW